MTAYKSRREVSARFSIGIWMDDGTQIITRTQIIDAFRPVIMHYYFATGRVESSRVEWMNVWCEPCILFVFVWCASLNDACSMLPFKRFVVYEFRFSYIYICQANGKANDSIRLRKKWQKNQNKNFTKLDGLNLLTTHVSKAKN